MFSGTLPIFGMVPSRLIHLHHDKCLVNVLGGGNLSPFSLSEKGLRKAAFLLHTHVLMTASTLAWGFNRSQP